MPAGLNHRKGAGDDSIPSRKVFVGWGRGWGWRGGASASSIWTGAGAGVGAGAGGEVPVQAASGVGLGPLKTAAAPNRDTCVPLLQFTSFGFTSNGMWQLTS